MSVTDKAEPKRERTCEGLRVQAARLAFVECPYCDGENLLPGNGSAYNQLKNAHHEIACKYCQCLFLLSESKQGVQFRSRQQAHAA